MNMRVKAQSSHEQVSALMDGRLQSADRASALHVLATDDGRECWHVYHVIGDVLRSSELAACRHDRAFLQRLSAQLATEPVRTMASVPTSQAVHGGADVERPAANDGVFRWKMAAGFASFAAVAAIGWGMLGGLGPQQGLGGAQMAQGTSSAAGARVVSLAAAPVPAASASGLDAPAVMIRDPQLDELLAAHRQAAGVSALSNASGFLRNATFEGSGR